MDNLYAVVTDSSNIIGANISTSHNGSNSTATVECTATSLDISAPISIDLGYDTNATTHDVLFTGYVKNIELSVAPKIYTITASDVLIRAQEYFIVSNNPESPLEYNNASPEDIIHDLMELAGITSYSGGTSSYVWGVNGPIKISLVSAYDYSKFLADLIAWQLYTNQDGVVHFKDRRPYPMAGDTAVTPTLTYANSTIAKVWKTDKDLRNRVVVWGTSGIYASADDDDSYDPSTDSMRQILPAGFYKTAVVSSEIIDSQAMAQDACDFNLDIYNRLSVGVSLSCIGNAKYKCRKTVNVDMPDLSIDDTEYYIYQSEHQWSQTGYQCSLELRL